MNRLDKYIKQIRGISYNPKDISEVQLEDYLPILKANNIQENGLETSKLIYIHKSKIKEEQLIKKGDLLLAASSGSKDIVGKNVFFENDFNGSFGAFCKVVRPNQNIYPGFLSVFFKTPLYKRHIRNLIQGANINNLRNEDIDSLKIPEFSQQDQLHIANTLSKAENLITQRKQSIALLDEFLKSTFLEMFGDPVRNEKGWNVETIDNLCTEIVDCVNRTAPLVDYPTEYVMIRTSNVRNSKINFKDTRYVTKEIFDKWTRRLLPKKGDIIFTREAPTGEAAIIDFERNIFLGQRTMLFRPNIEIVNAYFLLFQLMGTDLAQQINKLSSGSTVKHLSVPACKKFIIKVPLLALQNQFAQVVEKTEALKAYYQSSLQELENLYGSLSQRAFKGELTLNHAEEVLLAAEPEAKYNPKL